MRAVRWVAFAAGVLMLSCMLRSATGQLPGLVGRWDFDDGTGRDQSGHNHPAELGGARIHRLGNGAACVAFPPGAAPMRIPASSDSALAISRGTVSFWLCAGYDRATILEYDNRALQINDYRGDLQARFRGAREFEYGSSILDYEWPKYDMREWAFYGHPKAAIGDAQWHLFTVAYDDQSQRIVGWRDGEEIATVDLSRIPTEPLRRTGLTAVATGKGFMGFLDDLRIYNRPLSTNDVRALYESTKAIYAGRSDSIPHDRTQDTYRYREADRALYRAWLQYDPPDRTKPKTSPQLERASGSPVAQIVAEGSNSTIQTAAAELASAVQSQVDLKPAVTTSPQQGPKVLLGTPQTSPWIRDHARELQLDRVQHDGYVIKTLHNGETLVVASKQPAGVIFGTFDLVRRLQTQQPLRGLDVLENPQVPLRLVGHWSYFRGFPHDDWRGGGRDNSIYSWEELRRGDTKRIRDWVRLMASAGWNAICPSEVNWHYRDNFLDHLEEVETLARILRDYGMKLYWCPSYLLALDPKTADALYERVPDFGGYLMKLGSEKQNGDPRPPMVNRIADTLRPHGGKVVLRAFVYGNYRYTPEPFRNLIPYDLFAQEDGHFRDNVIITPKGSPMDWDFSAPLPALDGAIGKNLSGSEQVIDKGWPVSWVEKWKWWLEQDNYHQGPGSLNKLEVDCILGVSMIEPAPAWTACPLNMVNYYGLGRLAWKPDSTVDAIYGDWIGQTFGREPDTERTIKTILLMLDDITRKLYSYRGYRGVWLDKGDEGMVENKTPHIVNRAGIGIRSPQLARRLLAQYAPGLQEVYGDTLRGEAFLTTFHFAKHDQQLSLGRTLIQDVYGNMEEAIAMADQVVQLWKSLEGKIDSLRYRATLDALTQFAKDTRTNRDRMAASFARNTGRARQPVLAGLTQDALERVRTFNVRHFGARADGVTDDAASLSRALQAAGQAGGGIVFVPSGVYALSSLPLQSHTTLVLDAGAMLKALPAPDSDNESPLIWGRRLEQVKILGPGAIEGTPWTQRSPRPAITLSSCRDVEVRNLEIRACGMHALILSRCHGVLVDNVSIATAHGGLAISACRQTAVLHCHADCGQAAMTLDTSLTARQLDDHGSDVTIRNSFFQGGPTPIRMHSGPGIRIENTPIRSRGL